VALAASVCVLAVALLASAGGWDGSSDDAMAEAPVSATPATPSTASRSAAGARAEVPSEALASVPASREPASREPASRSSASRKAGSPAPVAVDAKALPTGSGKGRRIVFAQARQRVWLVDADGSVERTYLASGSVLDNLHPGRYAVYSRSRWAVGVDDSGVMEYFVRFTHGPSGAAIGFHTIPTKDGVPLQKRSQLGTPQSHGCIRQRTGDAIALWEFAPVGTKVVVVA
jgi:lipoprotein-anchoring transpeptidase ErfK/SrfK